MTNNNKRKRGRKDENGGKKKVDEENEQHRICISRRTDVVTCDALRRVQSTRTNRNADHKRRNCLRRVLPTLPSDSRLLADVAVQLGVEVGLDTEHPRVLSDHRSATTKTGCKACEVLLGFRGNQKVHAGVHDTAVDFGDPWVAVHDGNSDERDRQPIG